jgi:hypothetical protein
MSLAEWMSLFRELHEKAHHSQLTPREKIEYRAGRDELARALLAAQRLTLKPGETPRQALRLARALQVDLDMAVDHVRAMTIDLSAGGVGCLLAKPLPMDQMAKYSLRLPGSEPLTGQAKVVDVKAHIGNYRVCFAFLDLAEPDRERLELLMFDTVLAQIAG